MKKLLVLFIGLFIMVNGAVFAQETDDDTDGSQDGYVTGSVSNNVYYAIPIAEDGKFDLVQPMYSQHGVNSQVGISWIYNSIFPCGGLIRCEVTGYGSSQIVGTVPEIASMCVRIASILRNGSNMGSSSQNCLFYTTHGSISADYTVKGDPRGASWIVNTSHIIMGNGIYDNPQLQASVSL